MKKINLGAFGDFPIIPFLFMLLISVFATATIANASTRIQGGDTEVAAAGDVDSSIDTRSAGDEGNVSFSIPTEVPCVMKANGDVISPSNWEIRNTCQRKIKLSGVSVSVLDKNTEYFDWKLYEGDDSSGRKILHFVNSSVIDYSSSFTVPAGKSVSCRWWCDAVDSYIRQNVPSKLHIASVSLSFKSNEPTAFAVYSDSDKSLKFYSRIDVPSVGDTFNGSKVTAVYTGLKDYTYADGEDHNGIPTTPWSDRRSEIKYVDIVDRIHPSGISFWFQRCGAITEFRNLGNIDVSGITTIDHTFYGCSSVESIDCSSWDVSDVTLFDQVFGTCAKLKKVDITGWNTSKAVSFLYMFYSDISLRGARGFPRLNLSNCHSFKNNFDGCRSITTIDFSRLNLPPDVDTIATIANCANLERITVDANFCWAYVQNETLSPTVSSPSSEYIEGADDYGYWYDSSDGNGYLPTNIPQHHAATYYAVKPCFAVYSADDGSLCFYKRFDKPQEGGAIDGKTVTRLYDWGIEYKDFESLKSDANESYPLLPWIDEISNIKSVKAVDSGIRPKALSNWCFGMSNATSIDLTLIDTSRCTDFRSLFIGCSSIETLDLSNMDMSKMSDSRNMYIGCSRLKKISVSDTFRYALTSDSGAYHYLPVPDSNVIDGADGKWYDEVTGEGYAPKDVPTGWKGTYFASKTLYLENKDFGKWTLNDLIAVSASISSGASASLLTKATTAMNYGVTWNMTLTNGNVATYRIIGINHDNLSDGTGKAGLTFEVNNEAFGHNVPYTETKDTNDGWEKSYVRKCLNGGTLYGLMPVGYQQVMKSCIKMSDNTANGESGAPTETQDKMFLLSESEIYGTDEDKNGPDNRIIDEGNQYEYYLNKRVGKRANRRYAGIDLPDFVSYIDYKGNKWYSNSRFIRSKNSMKSSWSAISSSGDTMTTNIACYTCPAFCL